MQYGFVNGLGCDTVRYEVFSKIYDSINRAQPLWVTQIDLTNAYNTVNLVVLEQLLVRENVWSVEKLKLWRFLASNSKSFIQGLTVK